MTASRHSGMLQDKEGVAGLRMRHAPAYSELSLSKYACALTVNLLHMRNAPAQYDDCAHIQFVIHD